MTKRKRGNNSSNLLTMLDLEVLKVIKNHKDIGVLGVCNALNMTHRALKSHIRRLLQIRLIKEQEKQKHGKKPLMITNDGEKILEIFDRNLQKIK